MTDECHPDVASPYLLITTAVRQAYRQTRPGSGGAGCPDRAVQRRHHRTAGGCRTARLTCGCSQYARYLYVLRLVPVASDTVGDASSVSSFAPLLLQVLALILLLADTFDDVWEH